MTAILVIHLYAHKVWPQKAAAAAVAERRSRGHAHFSHLLSSNWCARVSDSDEHTRAHDDIGTGTCMCGVPSPSHCANFGLRAAVSSVRHAILQVHPDAFLASGDMGTNYTHNDVADDP